MSKYKVKQIDGKLMLTSSDVQVGDKVRSGSALNSSQAWSEEVYHKIDGKFQKVIIKDRIFTIKSLKHRNSEPYNNNINYLTEEGIVISPHSTFKVIGEISPEATWVKEGDEFDESQVQKYWPLIVALGRAEDPNIWEIQCSQCKHFH